MRVAITGARGRLGTPVAEEARRRGHEVVAIDRLEPEGIDLADFDSVVAAIDGCEALIHLAAISGPGRHPDHVVHDNNVTASYHALRAAAEAGIRRICQASSINAIGGRFSVAPRYDYLPLDEYHPTYAEDPYSLSKAICELQGEAIARRFGISIASLRLHALVQDREAIRRAGLAEDAAARELWGYTRMDAAVAACLAAIDVDLGGHEAFYVTAPDTSSDDPSVELASRWYPDVSLRGLSGSDSFFDCSKAARLLGWHHPSAEEAP